MTSGTGNNKGFTPLEAGCRRQPSDTFGVLPLTGFTLIEVMLAVTILGTGIIGVLSAYKALANVMGIGQYSIQASWALREKMSDIQRQAIEGPGVRPKYEQGVFEENYPDFSWEEEIETTQLCKYDELAGPTDCLDKVKVTVTNQRARPARKFSLVTYMENYEEEGGVSE